MHSFIDKRQKKHFFFLFSILVFSISTAAYRMVGAMRGKSNLVSQSYGMEEPRKISMLQNGNQERMKPVVSCDDLDTLINECERFHANWMDKMKTLNSTLMMEDIPLDKKVML